jgi:acyl carrier protein
VADTATTLDIDEFRSFIATVLELAPEEITDDARFVEDLGVDSLMSLHLAIELEKRYGVSISDSHLKSLNSFAEMRAMLAAELARGASG